MDWWVNMAVWDQKLGRQWDKIPVLLKPNLAGVWKRKVCHDRWDSKYQPFFTLLIWSCRPTRNMLNLAALSGLSLWLGHKDVARGCFICWHWWLGFYETLWIVDEHVGTEHQSGQVVWPAHSCWWTAGTLACGQSARGGDGVHEPNLTARWQPKLGCLHAGSLGHLSIHFSINLFRKTWWPAGCENELSST